MADKKKQRKPAKTAAPRVDPPADEAAKKRPTIRIIAGAAVMVVGFGGTFMIMANEHAVPRGALGGILLMLVGISGALSLLGHIQFGKTAREAIPLRETSLFPLEGEPLWLSPLVTVPVSLLVFAIGCLVSGYEGLPITVCAALTVLLLSALRRPALLVFTVGSFVFLPFLGVYGLWDPWETHYGEVAREILSRNDWISLWWAHENWFFSKPILIFWAEALSMGALGVDYSPDANPAHPEWAIRLPHFLLAMGALLGVHALVRRVWGKRAGVVAAVVLATMPHFFFLSHQAITDMPFVACMTMAMSMLGLALVEDPNREVREYRLPLLLRLGPLMIRTPLTVSVKTLLIGGLLLVTVPQILYLVSRNLTLVEGFLWAPGADVFRSGSAGNHGLPGHAPIANTMPVFGGIGAQPATQALIWAAGLGGILWMFQGERRAQPLYALGFYIFCGLAFMAKGIPGFALPGLAALLFLIATGRWNLLAAGRLRVAAGVLTVIVVGMPWYVAMYMRHGTEFLRRLLIHDHINRLTAGVHMDETRAGSIGYFIEQMGVGMWPWIGLIPLALSAWFISRHRPAVQDEGARFRRQILVLLSLWLAAAFTLFSAMTTKFHHYIFPAVPPAAMLVGIALSRLMGPRESTFGPAEAKETGFRWRTVAATALALVAPIVGVLGIAGLFGDPRGVIPPAPPTADGTPPEAIAQGDATWVLDHPWPSGLCITLVLLALLLFAGAWWMLRPPQRKATDWGRMWTPAAISIGLLCAPVLIGVVGRDLSWVTDAHPQGYERLIHLFVYNYQRPWPEYLDYQPILTGFAIVATTIAVMVAIPTIRNAAARALIGVALAFSVWCLDVYIVDLSPHWGQRELLHAYYEDRSSPDDPLVAWQMNWKGENFYSGNHLAIFVDLDNSQLRNWLRERQGQTVYFLLEHGRVGSLRGVLGNSEVTPVTGMRDCNKFVLVRATIGRRAARPSRD